MTVLKSDYSILGKIQIICWLVKSKFISRRVRLIRFPITIRGRRFIDFGDGLTTGLGCRLECYYRNKSDAPKLKFGYNVQLNDYVHIVTMNSVEIGDNVLMASHVFISDNSHGSYKGDENDTSPLIPPAERNYTKSTVKIANNVWLGEGVIVMPGVEIGEGCVIGAHSIVSYSIPANTIAVGSPARPIKRYDFDCKRWRKIDKDGNYIN